MKDFKIKIVLLVTFLFTFSVFSQEGTSQKSLVGTHKFGVQFIWDGYGTAEITEDDQGVLHIKAEQYSNNKEEYVLLDGIITLIDERNFTIVGSLKLFTEGCCGLLDREINYTFRKTGTRKYWRLKEREELCSQYTCAYYLDIFE